jgi:Trk-type K+ transport system membrane component
MVLMLIGASPGSTGGGMKTSTIAVAAAAIWNTFQGNTEVLMFKRMIPSSNVLRAFSIIVIFLLITYAGVMTMQWLSPETEMTSLMFESISALTTTGLSINGTTPSFGVPAKLMLALLMFIGRMGPFTIMLFLLSREKPGQLKYPQERIIIG